MESTSGREYNSTLAALLCVYFVLLFRTIVGGIPQLFNSIIPDILRQSHPRGWALFYLVYYLWVFYGFWAIVLSLKRSRSAIPALKLALPFSLVSFIISSLPKLTSLNFIFLAIVAFYIGFLIFLSKSDALEEDFPEEERRLGVPGYIGVTLYSIIALLAIAAISDAFIQQSYGKDVPISKLSLREGEVSDGRTIFIPEPGWIQDSTSSEEGFRNNYFYHTKEGTKVTVISCKEDYEPSRDTYIYSIYEDQPLGVEFFKDERNHNTTECKDEIIYVDQYRYVQDSSVYYWTYASRLNGKLMKGIRISILERDSLKTSIADMERLLGSCSLQLRERLLKNNRVNQKDNSDNDGKDGYSPPGP